MIFQGCYALCPWIIHWANITNSFCCIRTRKRLLWFCSALSDSSGSSLSIDPGSIYTFLPLLGIFFPVSRKSCARTISQSTWLFPLAELCVHWHWKSAGFLFSECINVISQSIYRVIDTRAIMALVLISPWRKLHRKGFFPHSVKRHEGPISRYFNNLMHLLDWVRALRSRGDLVVSVGESISFWNLLCLIHLIHWGFFPVLQQTKTF